MAKSDVRRTVLDIINRVQERLGIDPTPTLTSNKQVKTLLQLLNETIDDISDFGNWIEMYAETGQTAIPGQSNINPVVAVSGQSTYSMGITYPIKNLYEISFDDRPQSMYNVELETINRYNRAGGAGASFGEPRYFATKYVDVQGNPIVQVYPVPGANEAGKEIHFCFYRKPRLLDYNSLADELEFPGNLIIQGLYARALLEENGGMPTDQSKYAWDEYNKQKQESINRFNSDTSTYVQFQPAPKR